MALLDDLLHHISGSDLDSVNAALSAATDQEIIDIDPPSWGLLLSQLDIIPLVDPSINTEDFNFTLNLTLQTLNSNSLATIDQIVDPFIFGGLMSSTATLGNLDGLSIVIDNMNDVLVVQTSTIEWAQAIQSIAFAPFIYPTITQEDVENSIRHIMEKLAANELAEVTEIISPFDLEFVLLRDFSSAGNLGNLEAIVDNLNDVDVISLSPFAWGEVITNLSNALSFDPSVSIEEVNTFIRDLMEKLAANEFAEVSEIIADPFSLQFGFDNFAFSGNFEAIDAITDHLDDQFYLNTPPFFWSQLLYNIATAPIFNPEISQEDSNIALRDFMEKLAGNELADIADLLDPFLVNFALGDLVSNANLDGLDAIIDNLSDQAALSIDFVPVLFGLSGLGPFNPDISQDDIAIAVKDLFEFLSQNEFAPLENFLDSMAISLNLGTFSINGNLGAVDAIIDNLNDNIVIDIGPFDWGSLLNNYSQLSFLYPELTQTEIADSLRNVMELLSNNALADLAQIVNPLDIAFTMQNFVIEGNLEAFDAIIDNVSDQLVLDIAPFDVWSSTLTLITQSGVANPELSQQDINDAIRDMMGTLEDNELADITQLIDMQIVDGVLLEFAGNDNFDGVDAILSALDDTALTLVSTDTLEQDFNVTLGSNSDDFILSFNGSTEAIYGLDGDDYILGVFGDNYLSGGDGDDTIIDLLGGDDVLYGGNGDDLLIAGFGADTFVFKESDTGTDTIIGFKKNQGDKLDLSDLLDNYNPLQDAIEDFIILTTDRGNLTVSVDSDGTGAGAAQEIAVITGGRNLDIDDLIDTGSLV